LKVSIFLTIAALSWTILAGCGETHANSKNGPEEPIVSNNNVPGEFIASRKDSYVSPKNQWRLVSVLSPEVILVKSRGPKSEQVSVRFACVESSVDDDLDRFYINYMDLLMRGKWLYLEQDPKLPNEYESGNQIRYVWTVAECVPPKGGDRLDDLVNVKLMIHNGAKYDMSEGESTFYHASFSAGVAPVRKH
jgi:hypothetical protein